MSHHLDAAKSFLLAAHDEGATETIACALVAIAHALIAQTENDTPPPGVDRLDEIAEDIW